jgi:hypothetical protein
MHRQALSNGGWIDRDTCRVWEEDKDFDGNNMISAATGSQWDHQQLLCTSQGQWILDSWSQWAGSVPTSVRIDAAAAAEWLVKNDYDETAAPELKEMIADLEA